LRFSKNGRASAYFELCVSLNQLKLRLNIWGRTKNLTIAQKEYITKKTKSRLELGKKSSFRYKDTKQVLDKRKIECNVKRYERSQKSQGKLSISIAIRNIIVLTLLLDNVPVAHESPGLSVFTPSTMCPETPRDLQSPPAQSLGMVLEEEVDTSIDSIMMDVDDWPPHIEASLLDVLPESLRQFQLPTQ